MSLISGKNGVVKAGATNIAEVKQFDVDHRINTIDVTAMGDTSKKYINGIAEWNGSLTCVFESTGDAGQKLLKLGDDVALSLDPDGSVGGELTGNATITSRKISVQTESFVELAITFQGNGDLTDGTIT
ncbi:MAG: hypothetical protein COB02_13775 [Candidatus Cloacimonadota bacterium]|nr:MAG: hypothetical protein COB02_13775 [Candidatus Cloacimonadota bacterium]